MVSHPYIEGCSRFSSTASFSKNLKSHNSAVLVVNCPTASEVKFLAKARICVLQYLVRRSRRASRWEWWRALSSLLRLWSESGLWALCCSPPDCFSSWGRALFKAPVLLTTIVSLFSVMQFHFLQDFPFNCRDPFPRNGLERDCIRPAAASCTWSNGKAANSTLICSKY